MTDAIESPRRFSIRPRDVESLGRRIISAATFEAAAVAYAEDVPASVDGAVEIKVIVRDVESGHEHCFCISLDGGETEPCG